VRQIVGLSPNRVKPKTIYTVFHLGQNRGALRPTPTFCAPLPFSTIRCTRLPFHKINKRIRFVTKQWVYHFCNIIWYIKVVMQGSLYTTHALPSIIFPHRITEVIYWSLGGGRKLLISGQQVIVHLGQNRGALRPTPTFCAPLPFLTIRCTRLPFLSFPCAPLPFSCISAQDYRSHILITWRGQEITN
jgi:hypothetical protein